MSVQLWPHQERAIQSAVHSISLGHPSGLWVMPTGTVKTRAFATLARRLDLPTLIIVHRDELVRQTVQTFEEVWPEAQVGTLPGKDWKTAKVVVATVQSMKGRLARNTIY